MPPSYEELRQRHVLDMRKKLPEHMQRIRWSREQIQAERQTKLRELLRVAKDRSPWHAKRLVGIDEGSFKEDDLRTLPVMTKVELMSNYDEIVTDGRLSIDLLNSHLSSLTRDAYLLDRYHVIASGGTSGLRGVFVYDWDS